ncbi:claudin-8-like [Xyrauchen texanus]|uniref:claudin-8-like n=1 Tax=Xyrauchen texanus TaxID=154827 RepID=UPI0022425A7E|nr:claudin-8-like [Xyrauchen texanus]
MSYMAGSYVDKSYMGKPYGGSAFTGYTDEKAIKEAYEEQLKIEKRKRRESIYCEVVALIIGFIGLIGVAAVTGLPMWKVTAFIEENIIVMETRWEGLWMNCYRQANIRMQCKVYDSLLYLPAELQASRGLMCTSVALTTFAFIMSAVGMRCTRLIDSRPRTKHIVLVSGGCLYLAGCITTLIPVSWTGHAIIRDFYNPLLIDAQRRELGEALYIGWVTSAVLFIAGVILLCRHAPRTKDKEDMASVLYRAGSAPYNYSYSPRYGYQPAYTYQPAYSYQPGYSPAPPAGYNPPRY